MIVWRALAMLLSALASPALAPAGVKVLRNVA